MAANFLKTPSAILPTAIVETEIFDVEILRNIEVKSPSDFPSDRMSKCLCPDSVFSRR